MWSFFTATIRTKREENMWSVDPTTFPMLTNVHYCELHRPAYISDLPVSSLHAGFAGKDHFYFTSKKELSPSVCLFMRLSVHNAFLKYALQVKGQ